MDDSISRQAAINVLNKHSVLFEFHLPHEFYEVKEELRGLPSTQPEIIRCEDCRHNGSFDTDCPIDWEGKEYCNFAER